MFKVVRQDLTSLNLRVKGKPFEPNQYKIGEWTYPRNPELGGLFVCRNLTGVCWLLRYISNKKVEIDERNLDFSDEARVFEVEIGREIGETNSKFMAEVDKVRLGKELFIDAWRMKQRITVDMRK